MTNKPYNTLVKDGLNGTLYNWIGRSNYGQDVYLRNTLIYDFRIYNAGLGAGDIQDLFEVNNTLRNLDNAYYENPDYIDSALQDETDALTLDLPEFVTENIILPTTGTSNPDILISWISNRPTIVDEKGYVARPAMFDYPVKLTAVLSRDGQSLEKDFNFTVKAAEGTEFKDNLLVHFDFSPETVNGNKVTDRAEKNFTGTVMNEASIIKIGNDAEQFNVLSLGSNTGYFDMGEDMGAIIYNLKDFTMSAYFYIKDDYEHITSNGNFLWNFSNSDDVMTDLNGYVIGSVKDQAISIAKTNYKDQQSLAMNMNMNEEKGTWHHLAFTLEGNVMNLYYDGNIMDQNENFTYVPSDIVPVDGRMGTNFNWIGRSCYAADSYLKDTYVHDFRLYNKALDPDELAEDVDTMLNKLNEAVALGVNSQIVSDINLYSENGTIYILNQDNSSENVFDILGRKVNVSNN